MEPQTTLKQPSTRSLLSLKDLPGPHGLPFVGNALQITPELIHRQLEDWAAVYGKRYRVALGPRQYLVCSDPDDISRVLRDRPKGFRRSARLEMVADELTITGLFSSSGEQWKRQRPLIMSAFNPAHVKSYFPSLRLAAERLLGRWRRYSDAGQTFELEPELMRYTVDVTAGLAFGTDINTIESDGVVIQEHLKDIFRMLQKRALAPFPYWHRIRFEEDRKLEKDVESVGRAVEEFIRAARVRMESDPGLYAHPRNLLEAMIAARDENDASLSEKELAGNVLTMLLAGEDTTAHTIAWLLHLLHQHPTALERVVAEVDDALGDARLPARHEELGKLDFVEACIEEAMRLRPVAPMMVAEANEDTSIGDVAVKKGTAIFLLARVAAMDDSYFAHAKVFDPDRWLGPATAANRRKTSIPFGAGPRTCPGRYLALEEMKVVVSMLVRNFTFAVRTSDGGEVKEKHTFTMAPADLQMTLRAR